MSKEDFEAAVASGRPYFGPYKMSRRSWPHIYWYQQKLMRMLADEPRSEPLHILEIGAWAGASTVSWASALREHFAGEGGIVSIDPWQSIEVPDIRGVFDHNIAAAGFADLIEPFHGTSEEAFQALAGRRFDIVYIDGDHNYPFVRDDIAGARMLLKDDGVICGDDLEIQAHEIDVDLRAIIAGGVDWNGHPVTGLGYHPGVTLAVAEAFGPVSSWHGFWAIRSRAGAWEALDLENVNAGLHPALWEYDNDNRKIR